MADGWSALGAVAGSVLSGALSQRANSQGVLLSAQQQKELMNHQAKLNWKYFTKEMLEKYQLGRQGLINGGYNPMLALTGLSGNSSWASQSSINDTGAGSAYNGGFANATQRDAVRQQGNLIESQVGVNNADSVLKNNQAVTEVARQMDISADVDLKTAQTIKTNKESSWVDKEKAQQLSESAWRIKKMNNDIKIGNAQLMIENMRYGLEKRDRDLNYSSNSLDYVLKREQYDPNTTRGKLGRTFYHAGANLRDLGIGKINIRPGKGK